MTFLMNDQQAVSDKAHPQSTRPLWRREPEIASTRQEFLRQRLTIVPDIQQGIYPFKDVTLTRADVEWLLITHEQGRGPIAWSDLSQRERQGIDLRGADLRHANLCSLPCACIRGGLTKEEWVATTLGQRALAGVHLEWADLSNAHLEGALLRGAFLQGATLRATVLEQAVLFHSHLEHAYLRQAHLEEANMMYVHLEGAYLRKAWLTGADLRHAVCDNATNLEKVTLLDKQWGCAVLADIHWGDCNLTIIDWQHVMPLGDEVLTHALLRHHGRVRSFKEKHYYFDTYQAPVRAYRQLANAMRAQGMNEEAVPFAYRAQVLQREILWREVLWGQISTGDQGDREDQGNHKGQDDLHDQGDRKGRPYDTRFFALRVYGRQVLRNVLGRMRSFGAYIFSWLLDVLAGYGYKPGRSLSLYLLMIASFATCYLVLGHLSPLEALIFSVISFHGRGFLPGPFPLSSPVTALAALEAVVGLVIEVSFIATFTQRFFGR